MCVLAERLSGANQIARRCPCKPAPWPAGHRSVITPSLLPTLATSDDRLLFQEVDHRVADEPAEILTALNLIEPTRGAKARWLPRAVERPRDQCQLNLLGSIAGICDASGMRYPGGKGRAFQFLIGLMPPHDVYIETHLGGGSVMLHKRPARVNIGVEIDPAVVARWRRPRRAGLDVVHQDAASYLSSHPPSRRALVYADPPYWPAARRRPRCYRHDYTERQHEELLDVVGGLDCMVMISGYDNELYRERLARWERREFVNQTHTGAVVETVWLNFEPGDRLHDYSYIGSDFRERERLRRMRDTHILRLHRAPPLERNALIHDVALAFPDEVRLAMESM